MMSYSHVSHVLFDMDGLLLNTEDLYTIAFQSILQKYGKNYTYDIKRQLMGFQTDETADKIIEWFDLPMSREDFKAESKEQFERLFPESQIMPGAQKLVEHFHKHRVPIGLATSSSKESYEMKTQNHKKFFSLFEHHTWGSSDPEVKKGKPHPDIFLVAAAKFKDKPLPKMCLVFEDAINGVKAARAAGMQVVMVPDPQLDRAFTSEATLVIDSLEDFKPELFGLPPF